MYEQYKAIVALNDLVNNPKALKEAASAMSEAIALNDAEIAKRNEYNDIITAGSELQKELAKQKAQIDSLNTEYHNNVQVFEADKSAFEQEVKRTNENLESQRNALKLKESELNTKEGNLNQKASELNAKESLLAAKQSELNAKEFDVSEREAKINAIVNAGK